MQASVHALRTGNSYTELLIGRVAFDVIQWADIITLCVSVLITEIT